MLDKKLIGFRQTVREFLKSKTNQAALISIVGLSASFHTGAIPMGTFLPGLLTAIFAMTIKDATIKDV